jgi:RNA polymerase sigma factor (TIGR02999 family)
MTQLTKILKEIEQGDPQAAGRLLPLVYNELRRLAAAKLASEAPGQTLQPTALVHEAYLRLVGSERQLWENCGHFFAAAAEAMRRILVENARRKQRVKHGGDMGRVNFDNINAATCAPPEELFAVHEALSQFELEEPVKAQLVKLRYFAGMSIEEAAAALSISRTTASRYWTYARAWLFDHLTHR